MLAVHKFNTRDYMKLDIKGRTELIGVKTIGLATLRYEGNLMRITLRHPQPTDEDIFQWANDNPGCHFEYVNGEILIDLIRAHCGKACAHCGKAITGYRVLADNGRYYHPVCADLIGL